MRQASNIQVQAPSTSPTYALSRPASNPDVPPSLRRNLFGSHLSRRPAPPYLNAATDHLQDPFDGMTSTIQQQPGYHHVAQQPQNPIHSSNSLIYDSRTSQSRSLSPQKLQSLPGSSSSIVALDPVTGRPQLPIMPRLPSRMPQGSDDEGNLEEDQSDLEDEDEADDPVDEHAASWRRLQAFEKANAESHDLELHSSSMLGGANAQQSRVQDIINASAGRLDQPRIQSILTEMVAQQKAKARTAVVPETAYSHSFDAAFEDGVSARTRGKARANTKTSSETVRNSSVADQPRVGGVGATLDPADKDELLSAIMTRLNAMVQQADEDAWMFGDERTVANGVSVSGSFNVAPRDELGIDT